MDQTSLEIIRDELSLGKVIYLPSTGSTNDVARNWLMENVPHYSVVVADEQTRGRGRRGRKWFTLKDSALAFSIILSKGLFPNHLLRYSGLGSLAVCETLSQFTNALIEIKWPNDILINKHKIGGVLVEAYWVGAEIKGVVLGIGINISQLSLPSQDQLNFPATFLEEHTQMPHKRVEILRQIIIKIQDWNKRISTLSFLEAWDQKLAYKGQTVQIVVSERESHEGQLIGLTNNGEIVIKFFDGTSAHFNANEIKIRPQDTYFGLEGSL